jgi:predicted nuclease of predicted toxin-antitoxin system
VRILLDNCVHIRLRSLLPGHDVKHTSEMGWDELENGRLIRAASAQFDLCITADKGIRHQQNLANLPIPIIELNSRDMRWSALKEFEPHILDAVQRSQASKFLSVFRDGRIVVLA